MGLLQSAESRVAGVSASLGNGVIMKEGEREMQAVNYRLQSKPSARSFIETKRFWPIMMVE
jgi:hypothetical protein